MPQRMREMLTRPRKFPDGVELTLYPKGRYSQVTFNAGLRWETYNWKEDRPNNTSHGHHISRYGVSSIGPVRMYWSI